MSGKTTKDAQHMGGFGKVLQHQCDIHAFAVRAVFRAVSTVHHLRIEGGAENIHIDGGVEGKGINHRRLLTVDLHNRRRR